MTFVEKVVGSEQDAAGSVLTASEFARTAFEFEADEKQRVVLDSRARMGIVNCSRQWGKTTVVAAKAVHRAWTEKGCLVLAASPGERQSRVFVRAAKEFVKKLGVTPRGDGDNEISLMFPNGSRIVGLPGRAATIRGFAAVSLLLIDEAAQVPEELYLALRPMLAVSNGDLWMMSTPFGARGFFWETWEHGGEEWERVRGPATECARISKEFLERERKVYVAEWFAQEYLCEFTDAGGEWFGRRSVELAMRDEELLGV